MLLEYTPSYSQKKARPGSFKQRRQEKESRRPGLIKDHIMVKEPGSG